MLKPVHIKASLAILLTILIVSFQNCEGKFSKFDPTSTQVSQNSEDPPPEPPPTGKISFYDNFETANLSLTSSDGFRWGSPNRTSIVTRTNVVWNGQVVNNPKPEEADWTPRDGSHSLRFRYHAGQSMSEQRFFLGRPYPDLWIRYWIRVPINFTHGALNNKWIALWMVNYDSLGDVTWQTRPNGNGGANLVVQDGGVANPETLSVPFISVPADRGRWMQVVIRVKPATGANANNGIIQFYRRWGNETTFTKLHEKLNAKVWETGSTGIGFGYLMGWANEPYPIETEWLMDQFTISDESLL